MIKKGIAIKENELTPWTICWTMAMSGILRYKAVKMEEAAKANVIGILMKSIKIKDPIKIHVAIVGSAINSTPLDACIILKNQL